MGAFAHDGLRPICTASRSAPVSAHRHPCDQYAVRLKGEISARIRGEAFRSQDGPLAANPYSRGLRPLYLYLQEDAESDHGHTETV